MYTEVLILYPNSTDVMPCDLTLWLTRSYWCWSCREFIAQKLPDTTECLYCDHHCIECSLIPEPRSLFPNALYTLATAKVELLLGKADCEADNSVSALVPPTGPDPELKTEADPDPETDIPNSAQTSDLCKAVTFSHLIAERMPRVNKGASCSQFIFNLNHISFPRNPRKAEVQSCLGRKRLTSTIRHTMGKPC